MNRQTDWQGEQDISSLWSITSWISISITGSLMGCTKPGAWVGGVKPPHCQQWLASSSPVWCLCIVFLRLQFSNTAFTCSSILPHPSHNLALSHDAATLLFTIFKYKVIKTEFTSTLVVESPRSHSNHYTNQKIIEWLRLWELLNGFLSALKTCFHWDHSWVIWVGHCTWVSAGLLFRWSNLAI